MLVYYHPTHHLPPAFLQGARDLSVRQCARGGCFFGIGPGYLCGFNLDAGIQLDGGWLVAIVGAFDPFVLHRDMIAQPMVGVPDCENRTWVIPIILNQDGTRAFPVRYGADWKPIISKEQKRMLDFAQEAKNILPTMINGENAQREELMPIGCSYVAEAIAYANHISVEVLSKAGLVDSAMVAGGMTVLCNFQAQSDA